MLTMLTLRGSEPVVRQVGSDSIDVEEVSLFGSLEHLKKRSRPSGTRRAQLKHASSPVRSVHPTNLGKIAAALFVIDYPCYLRARPTRPGRFLGLWRLH